MPSQVHLLSEVSNCTYSCGQGLNKSNFPLFILYDLGFFLSLPQEFKLRDNACDGALVDDVDLRDIQHDE
jgi:hypothetical protein